MCSIVGAGQAYCEELRHGAGGHDAGAGEAAAPRFGLMYRWHGSLYLGAAHGGVGQHMGQQCNAGGAAGYHYVG